jgi:hypothetical protein
MGLLWFGFITIRHFRNVERRYEIEDRRWQAKNKSEQAIYALSERGYECYLIYSYDKFFSKCYRKEVKSCNGQDTYEFSIDESLDGGFSVGISVIREVNGIDTYAECILDTINETDVVNIETFKHPSLVVLSSQNN